MNITRARMCLFSMLGFLTFASSLVLTVEPPDLFAPPVLYVFISMSFWALSGAIWNVQNEDLQNVRDEKTLAPPSQKDETIVPHLDEMIVGILLCPFIVMGEIRSLPKGFWKNTFFPLIFGLKRAKK